MSKFFFFSNFELHFLKKKKLFLKKKKNSYADTFLTDGEIIMWANSDIYLDEQCPWDHLIQKVFDSNPGKVSLCFSRHEVNGRGDIWTDPIAMACWSQDAWAFQKIGKLPIVPLQMRNNSEFYVGNAPFCDGRMNFISKFFGNFSVFNLGLHLRILHYDRCRGHCLGRMIPNHNTDQRAKITQSDPFCETNSNVCPFTNFKDFVPGWEKQEEGGEVVQQPEIFFPNYTVNMASNCTILEPHTHKFSGEKPQNKQMLLDFIKARLLGISAPDITQTEVKLFLEDSVRKMNL